jgi:2-oxoglutarate ferredoxin oxidoreductase subunit alpha
MERAEENRLNDFVVKLANVNGTGSASANGLLMKSIFRMGVPVSGKNLFPSNIQGLPTWYEIRVSEDGHLGKSGRVDVMAAMNAQTYQQDLAEVSPGGFLIYDSTWPRSDVLVRDDITVLGIPLAGMCNEAFSNSRTRVLMKNVAYLGALVALLDIELDVVRTLLEEQFAAKPRLIDANMRAVKLGYDYVHEHFEYPLPARVERLDANDGHILIDGNTAAALGCVYAGATVGSWYPITPSTSLMDAFKRLSERYRVDPDTDRRRYLLLQAEDELAAIGMVVGASWAGARAFTATSGPGISLMSEFLGFAYFAEIPVVLFDVQRAGPSTGLPTRTQQGDLLACAYASHGDTRHVLLFPRDPRECFEMAVKAFDLAERLQTPVIVVTDLDIGMNDWMCERLRWDDDYRPDRGKVLGPEDLDRIERFERYADVDGDGIGQRTIPGVDPRGAFFTRGSGHTPAATYTEDAGEYEACMDRLRRKHDFARSLVSTALRQETRRATSVGVISLGACDSAVREALAYLADEDHAIDYLRIRAFPFGDEVQAFIDSHESLFIVEQNRDAQLRALLALEVDVDKARLVPILRYDGIPMDWKRIYDRIESHLAQEQAA